MIRSKKSLAIVLMIMVFGIGVLAGCSSNDNNKASESEKGKTDSSDLEVGDTISFGHYEQDANSGNGKEAISWRVLAVDKGRALLISELALDCRKYNETYALVTWETCSLRSWLNSDFINAAFNDEEKARIATVTVSNDANSKYRTKGGKSTSDRVFLLSMEEADTYFASNNDRMAKATRYAEKNDAHIEKNGNCCWLLRSLGDDDDNEALEVAGIGTLDYDGYSVNYGGRAIRPAIWVNQ